MKKSAWPLFYLVIASIRENLDGSARIFHHGLTMKSVVSKPTSWQGPPWTFWQRRVWLRSGAALPDFVDRRNKWSRHFRKPVHQRQVHSGFGADGYGDWRQKMAMGLFYAFRLLPNIFLEIPIVFIFKWEKSLFWKVNDSCFMLPHVSTFFIKRYAFPLRTKKLYRTDRIRRCT